MDILLLALARALALPDGAVLGARARARARNCWLCKMSAMGVYHPVLVHFPIVFFTLTLVCGVGGYSLYGSPSDCRIVFIPPRALP